MAISPKKELARQLLPKGVSYYGLLDLLSHEEFVELVERHGGRYVRYSHQGAFALLILGEGDLPVTPAGEPLNHHGRTVLSESAFLEALGEQPAAEAAADRSFTVDALADLLKLPRAKVKAWTKAGLLQPRAVDHGVPLCASCS